MFIVGEIIFAMFYYGWPLLLFMFAIWWIGRCLGHRDHVRCEAASRRRFDEFRDRKIEVPMMRHRKRQTLLTYDDTIK